MLVKVSQVLIQQLDSGVVVFSDGALIGFSDLLKLLLLAIHDSSKFEIGLLHIAHLHLELRVQVSVLPLQLLDGALEISNLQPLLLDLLIFVGQSSIRGGLGFPELLLEVFNSLPESLGLLRCSLHGFGLLIQEFLVLDLFLVEPVLELLEISLVVAVHLLNSEVELFDLLVLVFDLVLQVPLFDHDAVDRGIVPFELGPVLNIADRRLGPHVLVVLFGQHQQIVELFVLPIELHVHVVEPILIVLPHEQLLLDLLDQPVLGLGQSVLELGVFVVHLLQLVGEQISQSLDVGLVQLAHLDFEQFDLSLVVQHHLGELVSDLVVQLLYGLHSVVVGLLQQLRLVQHRLDLSLLCLDYSLQTVQFSFEQGFDVEFLGVGGVPLGIQLVFIEFGLISDLLLRPEALLLHVKPQPILILEQSHDLEFPVLSSFLDPGEAFLQLDFLLLQIEPEPLDLVLI